MLDVGAILMAVSLTIGSTASRPVMTTQDESCPQSLAYKAAEHIKATVPGYRDTPEGRKGAIVTLITHAQEFFDPDHTGYMDAQRFTDLQWAAVLVTLPQRQCKVTFDDYIFIDWGPEERARQLMKAEPFLRDTLYRDFQAMDRGHKGYLDRGDWQGIFISSLKVADKDRDGKVTFAEYRRK